VRQEKGYDFEYPTDAKLDGLTIERFNKAMLGFYQKREKLDRLIMMNISDGVRELVRESSEEPGPARKRSGMGPLVVFVVGFVAGAIGTSVILIRMIQFFTVLERERLKLKV
jgi:hypothetical protein